MEYKNGLGIQPKIKKLESLCVYCGANFGGKSIYREYAEKLGEIMAYKGITLVYGGAKIGLMGAVADAVMKNGGKVIGVIPYGIVEMEVEHEGLTELHIVSDMHQRKAKMASLADGIIALPGGIGTFDELCEMMTWNQLGFEHKPIGLMNINNYFNQFLNMLDHAIDEGFMGVYRPMTFVENHPIDLIKRFENAVIANE
jgi:uncharacterized protein (TIGR00730 family)